MPAPLFTSNESEILRLEGLYIFERVPPAEIAGVALNDVVVCSEAIRGPIGKAVLCGSPSRLREVYGGRDLGLGGTTTSPLWRALLNKPFSRVWVARAAAAAAVKATVNLSNVTPTAIVRVDASSVGVWGNDLDAEVKDATDADANHFNLEITYLGGKIVLKNLNCQSGYDNLLATLGDDDGNWVTLTKLANGRPLNGASALISGADGSIADSDFTGTGDALELAAAVPGVGAVFIAERSSATLKTKVRTLAAASCDRLWLICADAETTSAATAITEAASNRDDRIVYCFNHPYTLDNETGAEILTHPTSWMASVLSQTDIDIHPGEEDTKEFTAGIIRLYNEAYSRADYIAFKDAGICSLEKDTSGFAFVSGVTTSVVPGKEQITRRRMADFILISLANSLKFFVKKKNTVSRRQVQVGLIDSFLGDLKAQERVVENFAVDGEILNTVASRSLGIEKIKVSVELIKHQLHLVLDATIGTNVRITETT